MSEKEDAISEVKKNSEQETPLLVEGVADPGTERSQQSSILEESVKQKDDLLDQLESQVAEIDEGN